MGEILKFLVSYCIFCAVVQVLYIFSWGRIAGCIMRVFCGIVEVIIQCFVLFGYRLYGCMAVWLYLDTVCMVV